MKLEYTFENKEKWQIGLLVCTALLAVSFFHGLELQKKTDAAELAQLLKFEKENPFRDLPTRARAMYVYDVTEGKVLYDRHGTITLPIASLTKLMTAVIALQNLPSDTVITIDDESLKQEGSVGLKNGEKWKLADLLKVMLIGSSNDAAYAIAGSVEGGREHFIKLMNDKAGELGLSKTVFYNESGLDQSKEKAGAYGSAEDIAKLLSYMYTTYPEYIIETQKKSWSGESEDHIKHTFSNTNTSVGRIEGIEASKTGFTNLAGGNLAVLSRPDGKNELAVVVLGSTLGGRYDDTINLIGGALNYKALAASAINSIAQ